MAAWPLPPAKRLVRGILYRDVSSNDSTFGSFSCARPLNRACLSPPPCAWHWTPRGSSCRNAPLLAVPSPAAPPVATPPFRRLLLQRKLAQQCLAPRRLTKQLPGAMSFCTATIPSRSLLQRPQFKRPFLNSPRLDDMRPGSKDRAELCTNRGQQPGAHPSCQLPR